MAGEIGRRDLQVLSGSVSFGKFESEELSWEKRSSFSRNKYLDEVNQCSKPGSVTEKKAYFEAHFKRKGIRGLGLGSNLNLNQTYQSDDISHTMVYDQTEGRTQPVSVEHANQNFGIGAVQEVAHLDELGVLFSTQPSSSDNQKNNLRGNLEGKLSRDKENSHSPLADYVQCSSPKGNPNPSKTKSKRSRSVPKVDSKGKGDKLKKREEEESRNRTASDAHSSSPMKTSNSSKQNRKTNRFSFRCFSCWSPIQASGKKEKHKVN